MKTGDQFEQTFRVTPEIYSGFIQIFHDKNPLHLDETFALLKGFKGKVMHGNILNGFLSFFIGECLPIKNVIILAQEIKFSLPVYENDLLQFHAEIKAFHESVNAFDFQFFFENKSSGKVARGKFQIRLI